VGTDRCTQKRDELIGHGLVGTDRWTLPRLLAVELDLISNSGVVVVTAGRHGQILARLLPPWSRSLVDLV